MKTEADLDAYVKQLLPGLIKTEAGRDIFFD